jgi:hypothetical protein
VGDGVAVGGRCAVAAGGAVASTTVARLVGLTVGEGSAVAVGSWTTASQVAISPSWATMVDSSAPTVAARSGPLLPHPVSNPTSRIANANPRMIGKVLVSSFMI